MKYAPMPKQDYEIIYEKAEDLVNEVTQKTPNAYVKIEIYFHSGLYQVMEHNSLKRPKVFN
jgi:hypothetical protein